MALNIKNADVERLVADVARITGESKTETVRRALIERRQRLVYRVNRADRGEGARAFLEHEVWPQIPVAQLGRRLTSAEEDEILGHGSDGV